eukprot:CAMPEP_0194286906 /NCGR_PEP_ID=MMETSP0169-20130528/33571_1 /TAXON_ID=218684 /ORGANISM="Corethron pennatum, Strain L29A3" /LENGTH=761 /DNA_ID=CAMNT_0039033451 /DNA_START=89 /DNA_END=2374 /DNA_ORIENTATION=-
MKITVGALIVLSSSSSNVAHARNSAGNSAFVTSNGRQQLTIKSVQRGNVGFFNPHSPKSTISSPQRPPHATPLHMVSSVADRKVVPVSIDEPTGTTIGDTRGATLLLEDVAISRGATPLLTNVEFRVEPGARWGIVGPNGAGKSTLLGAITGTVRMDEGKALVGSKVSVGYLRQSAVSGSTSTVAEEAASEMAEINAAKERMEAAEMCLIDGDCSDDVLNELDEATTAFGNAGGWTQEQEVDTILGGLGFAPEDSARLCSDFSGGWQMRIALARLLLSKPSLLLLDEPSNHLDSSARDWLGKYLAAYDGSMVLVSHDLTLLEKSVNNIAEVAGGTVLKYVSCSYSKYLEEKDFRAKSAQAEYERNMEEAAKLQAFVDRFGASATKAASAQSRVKMLEKMKKEGKLTPPAVAIVASTFRPELILPPPPKAVGDDLLAIENADIGYENVALLHNISLVVKRGMKLILRGPNGAGKSTLMAALRGKLEPITGKRVENEKLRLGVFTQDLAQTLDVKARAIDLVTAHAREGAFGDINISDQDARSVMGRLGLGGEKPLRTVGSLSGGEKARVALSMFALKASNTLMLDEPSNHLDVECIEALSNALSTWGEKDGAVVVISHDRSFCDEVGFTHVGTVQDGTLVLEERSLDDRDWEQYDINGAAVATELTDASAPPPAVELTPEEKQEQKRMRKLAFNAPKQIKKLRAGITKSELRIKELSEEMMSVGKDVEKLTDLSQLEEKEQAKVDKMTSELVELEQLLIEIS